MSKRFEANRQRRWFSQQKRKQEISAQVEREMDIYSNMASSARIVFDVLAHASMGTFMPDRGGGRGKGTQQQETKE